MNDTEQKLKAYIEKTGMLSSGDLVITGVSGGADSVFLLLFLKTKLSGLHLKIRAVHVHHGIRGEEADRDARFVEQLCGKLEVPCSIYHRDIPMEAARSGMSLEEAGRAARRDIFKEEAAKYEKDGPVKIALAHHRDDQAETVLFRIARGTGIRGLAGIRPVEGRVIRPLLCLTKEEILKELKLGGISYCDDSTNDEDEAVRNRIRHHILPFLNREINAGSSEHLAFLAEQAALADDFIRKEVLRREGQFLKVEEESGRVLLNEKLRLEHPVLRTELIRRALEYLHPSMKDYAAVHIEEIDSLFQKGAGKRIDLPSCLRAEKTADGVVIFKNRDFEEANLPEIQMEICGEVPFPVPQKRYTKWLDYDKMTNHMPVFRYRLNGDFIVIDEEGHRKSLSDYFTDLKLPHTERDRIPVLAIGHEVLWIVGYRISRRFYVDAGTKQVLKVQVWI